MSGTHEDVPVESDVRPSLCAACAKDPNIRTVIRESGTVLPTCPVCGTQNSPSLDCADPALRSLFRALVRYHYSEWEYNPHMGGDDVEMLFFGENPITAYDATWDADKYEDALLVLIEEGYEPYETGISLYSGYASDGAQLMPLIAIKNDFDDSLKAFRQKLQKVNYFLLEGEARTLLEPHTERLENFLSHGTILHRARIGFENKAIPLGGWNEDWHFKPYSGEALSAPPPPLAGPGRLNRPGVSYLYLATDEETALSEVRPHPGHHVSVGAFECDRILRIADFNAISIRDFSGSDQTLGQFLLLKSIDELFSLPVLPEERDKYSLTQLLSDALRHLGFDGIGYRSSVGPGVNVAAFDPGCFRYLADSSKVVRINRLQYDYYHVTTLSPGVAYSHQYVGK